MSHTMRAAAMTASAPATDPTALEAVTIPKPTPGEHDLLVRVHAVSVNPVDVKLRAGAGDQDEPKVLGWDAAGVVEAMGAEVSGFQVGDEVYYAGDLTRPGTNSEWHLVDHRIVGRKPKSLSFTDAAALPLTAITAWETLFEHLRLTKESTGTLLVIGGAGGVGSLVVQLARQFTSMRIVATASRPESREWCRAMGAHDLVDHSLPLGPQVQELGGADAVFSAYTEGREHDIAAAMNPRSHLVLIDDPERFDIGAFKPLSAGVTPEFMFTRSMFTTADIQAQGQLLDDVADAIDTGTLVSTATTRLDGFSPATLLEAHRIVESVHAVGKVVVTF